MHHHGYTLKTMTTTRLRSADQRAPKRRSPVKTRLPHSRMTGLPAPTLWSAKPAPLTATTFHIPTRASSLLTHEPWSSAHRQGRIRYFGRQGRAKSRRNSSHLVLVLLLPFLSSLGCCHFLRSLCWCFSSSIMPSPSLIIPFLDNTTGAQHHHDNRIKARMWCLSIHSLTGGRWHVHAAWRLLGHGREC